MNRVKSVKWFLIGAALLLLTAVSLPVLAQDGQVTDDDVNAIAKNLFCPVCESTPLDVCGTQACAEWRELIRTQLAEGKSEEEIYEYFARQYGDGVLAEPPKRGANLILWFFPAIAVVLGGVLFGRYVMSIRAENADESAAEYELREQPSPPLDEGAAASPATENQPAAGKTADYLAKVEEELHQKNTGK